MLGRVTLMLAVLVAGTRGEARRVRYGFYRGGTAGGRDGGKGADAGMENTRRVFGGEPAELAVFPAVCALLDRYWSTRCSCAVVSPRWALTAAHCVSSRVAYVKYNARRPAEYGGDLAAVHYLYRHPGYKVVQEDEGRGLDVTMLHHDVGLVRTRVDMALETPAPEDALRAMRRYNPIDLKNEEVQVLGYGRTERASKGEELFAVRLRLVFCERGAWFHCMCGVAAGGDARGVCSGDSGGPVVFKGAQIGVTSMGPMECTPLAAELTLSESNQTGDATFRGDAPSATSVFTSLYNYADLVNATVYNTDQALRMRMIGAASWPRATDLMLAPLLILMPAR